MANPERLHPDLGHPFVEGRPGEAAVLLNLANWVAVDGGGVCHGWEVCGRLKMSAKASASEPEPTPNPPLSARTNQTRGARVPRKQRLVRNAEQRGLWFRRGRPKFPRTPERLPFLPRETEEKPKTAKSGRNPRESSPKSRDSHYLRRVVAQPRPEGRNRIRDREASHLEEVSGHPRTSALV